MPDMTEEEADALDELLTRTTPQIPPNGRHGFAAPGNRLIAIDSLTEDYVVTMALAEKKTPTEVLSDMVLERLARKSGGESRPASAPAEYPGELSAAAV